MKKQLARLASALLILSIFVGTYTPTIASATASVRSQGALVVIDNGGSIDPSATTQTSLTFTITVLSDKTGYLPMKLRYGITQASAVTGLPQVSSQFFAQDVVHDQTYSATYVLSGLTANTTYYYAVVDGDDPTYAYSQIFSGKTADSNTAPPNGVVVDTSVSGFYITALAGGIRTATSFTGNGELTSTKPVNVSIQVVWGDSPTTMTNIADVYLAGSNFPVSSYQLDGSGDKIPVTFKLDGLTGSENGKAYYYAYSKSGTPQIQYTQPTPVVLFTGGGGSTATPPAGNGGSAGLLTTAGATTAGGFQGGLVPCDGRTISDSTHDADPCSFGSLLKLVNNIINFMILLTIPIIAMIIAYIGYMYITSGGSEEARGKAKHAFMNAVIGMVCVLGAWLIINTILTTLGVSDAYKLF